jgi:medium-chain acyl-[acyl-carrier-protein] hydrolase
MLRTRSEAVLAAPAWITRPRPNPHAQLRLICIPYAGGSASVFRTWPDYLPGEIEVCAVQLPGRENRLGEPPFTELAPLLTTLAQALRPYLDRPFVLFGHSMGAIISFELTRLLRRQYDIQPEKLLVSGRRAPHMPYREEPIHQLPTPEFLQQLRQFDGTPAEILENPDLVRMVMPILRADFAICETYEYTPEVPLDCPIAAYGGLRDRWATYDDLFAWQMQTNDAFSLQMLPGNHFFLNGSRWLLLQAVAHEISQVLQATVIGNTYDYASTYLEHAAR